MNWGIPFMPRKPMTMDEELKLGRTRDCYCDCCVTGYYDHCWTKLKKKELEENKK